MRRRHIVFGSAVFAVTVFLLMAWVVSRPCDAGASQGLDTSSGAVMDSVPLYSSTNGNINEFEPGSQDISSGVSSCRLAERACGDGSRIAGCSVTCSQGRASCSPGSCNCRFSHMSGVRCSPSQNQCNCF